MDINRWQKIDTVVNKALLIQDNKQRQKYVLNRCKDDQKLYEEIKSLLLSIKKAKEEHFLE